MSRQEHVIPLLSDYIDGCLSGRLTRRVEAHLQVCLSCAQELEEWRAVLSLVSNHASLRCPIDCAEIIVERIREGEGGRYPADDTRFFVRAGRHRPSMNSLVWASLTALCTVLFGSWSLTHGFHSPEGRSATIRISARPQPAVVPVAAPERLEGAFSRNDSLILASDFAAEE